jgi:hypothetical protein
MEKKLDYTLGIIFAGATMVFLILFLSNDIFFNWAFSRHHNVLSWYIRPLFILPIALFAFKKSLTGISVSIFALFTSMFWFPIPETNKPQILSFLAYEMDYLNGEWTAQKIILSLSVPLFFIFLVIAAWKRNWKLLLITVIAAAILKVIWSILFSGEAGLSILKPAIIGLIICLAGFYYYIKKYSKKK